MSVLSTDFAYVSNAQYLRNFCLSQIANTIVWKEI